MDCKSNIIPFRFESQEVRTVLIKNEPWFVVKDVCGILDIHNPSEALRNLDDDEISNLSNAEVRNIDVPNRGMNIISESGLYSLIFRSRKPEAHRFRRWVTSESLPSICRTGSYTARPSESTEKRG